MSWAWRQNDEDIGRKCPPERLVAFPRVVSFEIEVILSSFQDLANWPHSYVAET
jgi:hypothetical protein